MALFLLSLLLSSCGNVYERQSVIYEEAVERISETKGLAMLFDNVLTAEALAAREMAILDEEEKEEQVDEEEQKSFDEYLTEEVQV